MVTHEKGGCVGGVREREALVRSKIALRGGCGENDVSVWQKKKIGSGDLLSQDGGR